MTMASDQPLLVHVRNRLYNITAFADKHPGGRKVLERVSGFDVDEYMRGDTRILGVKHEHSEAAYKMLEAYAVDSVQKTDPLLDEKRGMLFNVGSLGDRYWEWIHVPYDGSLRLFDSDFLERLTRTAWWVVPLIWLPVSAAFGLYGLMLLYQSYGLIPGAIIGSTAFSVGALFWTLVEYTLHRYVFHWRPDERSPTKLTLHFLIHGLHHKTPMDGSRLVFPPTPALFLVIAFACIYISILPLPLFCTFGAGKLAGYVMYDMTHYYLHHGRPSPPSRMHFLKVYHHNHHFKQSELGFGISSSLWDWVFGTVGMGPL